MALSSSRIRFISTCGCKSDKRLRNRLPTVGVIPSQSNSWFCAVNVEIRIWSELLLQGPCQQKHKKDQKSIVSGTWIGTCVTWLRLAQFYRLHFGAIGAVSRLHRSNHQAHEWLLQMEGGRGLRSRPFRQGIQSPLFKTELNRGKEWTT